VVREAVKNDEIEIFHLATAERIADTLTKDLSEVKFNYHLALYWCVREGVGVFGICWGSWVIVWLRQWRGTAVKDIVV
jgi:hypothetical protein